MSRVGSDTSSLVTSLVSARNLENGWGYKEGHSSTPVDTSLALQALKSANYTDQTVIFGAISYLLTTQDPDGGWGFTEDDDSNVFVTAQVLSALATFKNTYLMDQQIAKATTFLLSKQNPDGGFGTGASTVYETALAFIALNESALAQGLPLQNVVNHLTATQAANGSWNDDPYSTALALRALSYVKPDLAVTSASIAVSPANPTVGDGLTVTATISNPGLEGAADVLVRLLDNGNLAGEQTIAAINPLAAVSATFAISSLATPGEHILTVTVDPLNAVTEAGKANNSATTRIWARTAADLVIAPEQLTITPATPKPGETVALTAAIANMGESVAGAFSADLYDGDPASGGTKLGSLTFAGIAPGEWGNASTTFSLTATGVHTLYLVVDPLQNISEQNRANNSATKSITVSATGAAGVADLTIPSGGITLTPSRPRTGDAVTITLLARNQGTAVATTDLELFDGLPNTGGTLLQKSTVTLNPGEVHTVTVPWSATPGIHTLYAVLDRADLVSEIDKSNNRRTLAMMTDMVDIEVSASDIVIEPEHPMAGDPADVKITIQNRGIAATGPFIVSLYNNDPASGGTLLQAFAITDLAGDATQVINYPFTAARGTYRFYVVADSASQVVELSETNNLAIRSLLVKSSAEAKGPDLVPLEFDLTAATSDPQSLRISGMAKVRFQNKGDDKVITPFRVTIFEDKDNDGLYTEGIDLSLGFWDYSAPMNPSMVGTVTINLSGTLAFRDAPIYAMVDSGQTVFEQNESNNAIRKGAACEARPANPIQPVLKWQWRGGTTSCYSIPISSPVVLPLKDDNGDGKIDDKDTPSVVFTTAGSEYCSKYVLGAGILKALNGKNGQEILSISGNSNHGFVPGEVVVGGDINNDGKPELLVQSVQMGMLNFSNNGQLLWDNVDAANQWLLSHWPHYPELSQGRIAKIADIDGTGQPVIVSGDTVLNSNGSIRSARNIYWGTGVGGRLPGLHGMSAVADLDMDGKQEIVVGNAAYNSDGSVKWYNSAMPDGVVAIGNFNDDPYPEIVVGATDNGFKLYLLDHTGNIKWGPVDVAAWEGAWLNRNSYGSVPTVADFDGDGELEIGIQGVTKYFIIDNNGRLKRSLPMPGTELIDHWYTSATVFDLNGDGRPEIITYSDKYLQIFDGKSGSLLYQAQPGISNIYTMPQRYQAVIVADVDGDGHAELVVIGQDSIPGKYAAEHWVKVYRSSNNDWQGTRRIWNQPGYHVTNINDDGTIPRYETPSWLTNNSYLCNVPTSTPGNPYLAADVSASFVRVDMADYPGSVAITVRIGNGGAKALAAGLKISFIDGDPANGGVVIGTATTTKSLNPGDYEDVTLVWSAPTEGSHTLQILADADNSVRECNKSNNAVILPVYVTSGKPDLNVTAEDLIAPAIIPEGSLTDLMVTVRNVGSLKADNVVVRLYAGNPASGGRQIGGDQVISAIAAGGAATIRTVWNTLGSQGTSYLYAVVDPANGIVETNENNNTAIRQVTVTPADKPDLQIAPEDIAITPAAPTEGDLLTITADIHNRGLATGNVKVALYNGNPVSGGAKVGETVIHQLIPNGGSARATFALDTVGLAGSVTLSIKIDPDNGIDESNEANNLASRTIAISQVGLSTGVWTDKPAYGANENVQVTIAVAELKGETRTLTYDVQILDGKGVLTAAAATDALLSLGPNANLAFTVAWNTGTTYNGSYTVGVKIKENGRTVAKASTPLTIIPVKTADARIVVDKTAYGANEQVAIGATVTGTSPNHIFTDLTAGIRIVDGAGQSLYTETRTIPSLSKGQRVEVKGYWNTGIYPPGTYPAALEVKDASGAVIATGTCNLTISSAIDPAAALKGQIAVDKQSLLSGEPVNVTYSVTNVGNADLSNLAISVVTVHVVNQTVYDTVTSQTSLTMGTSYANSGRIDTTAYSAKDYLVVLQASINGVEETLAGTYFRVEGAPSAPALSGPAIGADVDSFTPLLSVSNAADPNDDRLAYEFEIYADSGLTNLVASGTVSETTGTTAWTLPVPLTENQTCYWRARAHDGRLYGPWMAPASFRVNTVDDPPAAPNITSPADGTAVAVLTPVLTVNNAADPDSTDLTYNFDLALDPDFIRIVSSAKGITGGQGTTSWTVPVSLAENGWYYWRAQADDWLMVGPWSTAARFLVNTLNDAPSTPVIATPANDSTVAALAIDAAVTNSIDPDSPILSYYFEADTVPTFDSTGIIRSGSVPAGEGTTPWHLSGLKDNTRYHLRVRASDGTADSPWSEVTSFVANTVNDPPTTPMLANPSSGAGVNLSAPTLSVHNAMDLDKDILAYRFEVYADAAMTNLVAQSGSMTEAPSITGWTIPVTLVENQTYYWQARAFDGSLYSGWMPVASFMINTVNDAPGPPTVSMPVNGSSVGTLTPMLAVTNAVDPDSDTLTYEFEIYAGTTLVASTGGIPSNGSGTTAWTPGSPLADNTVYQWRARAFDGDRYGQWMNMATFTTHVPVTSIKAEIEFEPETLNRKSQGRWVKVEIELPHGYRAADIDIASIRLEGTVPAEAWPLRIRHGEHEDELTVKFRRSDVIAVLPEGTNVPVHVTGNVGSTPFEGVDIIRVIEK